jgi:hypothetical protein
MTLARKLAHSTLNYGIRSLSALSAPFNAAANALRWQRLRHFWLKPRPGDIYIATSPKAGTTWVQMILYQLVTGGRGEFDHILQVSPFLEQLIAKGEAQALLDTLPSPRLLKTHLPYEALRPPEDSKVIYVTRNAADTLMSLYHHECLLHGFHLDLDGFVSEVLSGEDAWFTHLESWWPHRNDANVLYVRYEDLIADLEGGVRRIAAFLGLKLEEERMGAILEKCGFEYMKRHNDKFDFRMTFYDKGGAKGGFIRKGGVGGAKAQLKPEQRAALEEKVSRARQRLGIGGTEV